MPVINLNSDIATVKWDIEHLRYDRRANYRLIISELKIVNSSYPYTVQLDEKPYETAGVEINGYTEVTVMPTSSSQFYVDYESGIVYFHSTAAGNLIEIAYYGKGSTVFANDVNKFSDFLCTVKDMLMSFSVNEETPNSTNVLFTGGYLDTGTSLSIISDKILKFGAGQEYAVSAMTPFYWRKILVSVNTSTEAVEVTEGVQASSENSAVIPSIPANCKPCAVISASDNGNGGSGTIDVISQTYIQDVRMIIR